MLDDKSIVADLKPLYDKYGHEDMESIYDKIPNEYEDEYDDTYDSNTIGVADTNDVDELTARRSVFLCNPCQTQNFILGHGTSKVDHLLVCSCVCFNVLDYALVTGCRKSNTSRQWKTSS